MIYRGFPSYTSEKPGRSAPPSQLPPAKKSPKNDLEQFFFIHYPCVGNFLMFGLVLISTRCTNHIPYTIGEIKTGNARFHALIQVDLRSFDQNIFGFED